LDWFLFDIKKGYFNYFASSEVILLRSVGVPARLAVGFSEGEWNSDTSEYVVKIKDIHAWPEVYFNDFGWVEFEPTVSLPVTDFLIESEEIQKEKNIPLQLTLTPQPDKSKLAEREQQPLNDIGANYIRRLIINGVIAALIVLAIIALWANYRNRFLLYKTTIFTTLEKQLKTRGIKVPIWLLYLSKLSQLSVIERLFLDTKWMIKLLGKEVVNSQTPGEQISILIKALPLADVEANVILREYEKEIYSQFSGNIETVQKANLRLWVMVVNSWFNKTFRI
jgi:hypothetical protein